MSLHNKSTADSKNLSRDKFRVSQSLHRLSNVLRGSVAPQSRLLGKTLQHVSP